MKSRDRHRTQAVYNPFGPMGIRQAFESLLRRGKSDLPEGQDPVSIVLLLREPSFPTLEQLRDLSGKAFGPTFTGDRNARHSVYQRGVLFTLANVGPHVLSFLFYTRPYFADEPERSREFEGSLRRDDQKQAWARHAAYMAVDYANGEVDIDSKYAVLSKLCSRLYDANCVAIYLPRESALVPGEGPAQAQLDKIMACREVNVN